MSFRTTQRLAILATICVVVSSWSVDTAQAAPADLDTTFGLSGQVTTDFGGDDRANAVTIQPDGKILVAGQIAESAIALSRYNPDGSLDASFGTGGIVATNVGGAIQRAEAVIVQPDGRILVAGNSGDDLVVVRYSGAGIEDSTFGAGGQVVVVFGGFGGATSLAVQPDGRILVGGFANGPDYRWVIARLNADGILDPTFGVGGKVTTSFEIDGGGLQSLLVQPDGRLVASGNAGGGSFADFAIVRYNGDGSLDATFGTGGKATTDFFGGIDVAFKVLRTSAGQYVLGGTVTLGGQNEFGLARYNSNGSLDTTFGRSGLVATDFGGANGGNYPTDIAQMSNGQLVGVGCANCDSGSASFAVARYASNGSLDGTFGASGKTITHVGSGIARARAALIQSDGRLVAVGSAGTSPSSDFALLRYMNSVSTPTDASQCRKGGWQMFVSPAFKNQGDCISFVNHQ